MRQLFQLYIICIFLIVGFSCSRKDTIPPSIKETVVHNASFTGFINQAFVVDFLANDTINERATVSITRTPAHGSLRYDSQLNKYHYIPERGFTGADGFNYEVVTSNKIFAASVFISIVEMPCTHLAMPDYFIIKSGQTADFNILLNDKFCGMLNGVTLEGFTVGNCSINTQKMLSYHALIHSGMDTLRYALHGQRGIESEAQVIIRVIP